MRRLRCQQEIAHYLRQDAWLHLYALGDLDPFYWPHTLWYGLGEPLEALVLGYFASEPVYLALASPGASAPLKQLLQDLKGELQPSFFLHASPECADVLGPEFQFSSRSRHLKMGLLEADSLAVVEAAGRQLGPKDRAEVEEFYQAAYPGNWFDPRMLDSGQFYGIDEGGRLAAVAGVHVYSPEQRVAALGNIATLQKFRGQGLAARVTSRLCQSLLGSVDTIGLNVKADNAAAIRCYQRLGFQTMAEYEELEVEISRSDQ